MSAEPTLTPAMIMGAAPLRALIRMGGYAAVFGDDEAVALLRQITNEIDAELQKSSGVSLAEFMSGQ